VTREKEKQTWIFFEGQNGQRERQLDPRILKTNSALDVLPPSQKAA
jgi:hypothetical protein